MKNLYINIDEIDTRGRFHQQVHAQLLHAKIPQDQKDSQVISDTLHFWELFVQKLLVKHW